MTSITIDNIDDDLERRLKARADTHGRTVAEEARGIIEDALGGKSARAPGNLADAIRAIVEPIGGIELPPVPPQPVRDPPTFD